MSISHARPSPPHSGSSKPRNLRDSYSEKERGQDRNRGDKEQRDKTDMMNILEDGATKTILGGVGIATVLEALEGLGFRG